MAGPAQSPGNVPPAFLIACVQQARLFGSFFTISATSASASPSADITSVKPASVAASAVRAPTQKTGMSRRGESVANCRTPFALVKASASKSGRAAATGSITNTGSTIGS
jgi:hypothetical protein